eukprot:SAG31_NODE_25416_length_461_cov_6.850829_1_plen_62_part_01
MRNPRPLGFGGGLPSALCSPRGTDRTAGVPGLGSRIAWAVAAPLCEMPAAICRGPLDERRLQ